MAHKRICYKGLFVLMAIFLFMGLLVSLIPVQNPSDFNSNENNGTPIHNLADNPLATDDFETVSTEIWSSNYTMANTERVTTDPFQGDYCLKIDYDTSWYQLFTNDYSDVFNLSSSIAQYPFLRLAMKIPKGASTSLIVYMNDSALQTWGLLVNLQRVLGLIKALFFIRSHPIQLN